MREPVADSWVRRAGAGRPVVRHTGRVITEAGSPPDEAARVQAVRDLDLAVTRSIAERHGGRVSVRSEVGVGSTFSLHLPGPGQA